MKFKEFTELDQGLCGVTVARHVFHLPLLQDLIEFGYSIASKAVGACGIVGVCRHLDWSLVEAFRKLA